eukprot:9540107-Lingulodinium_polyedra.AAC.1
MRSNRPSAVATARKSDARALHVQQFLLYAWNARPCDSRRTAGGNCLGAAVGCAWVLRGDCLG